MDNHFHLMVQTRRGNLAEFMRHFNISYTSVFNRRHRRVGHLYQGRYKAILVDKDSYLLELSRYVHLNPVRIRPQHKRPAAEKRLTGKRTGLRDQRAMAMELMYRNGGIGQVEIGRLIGGLDHTAVSRERKRLRDKVEQDAILRKAMAEIETQLMSKVKI